MAFGPLTTRAIGPVSAPVVMQGSRSTVTGIYGTRFSNLAVQLQAGTNFDAEELDMTQTMLGMSFSNVPALYDVASGQTVRVDPTAPVYGNDCTMTISPNGEKIIASTWNVAANAFTLSTMNIDGSSKTPASVASVWYSSPSYNAAMSRILYSRDGDIYMSNPNGSSEVNLTSTLGSSEFAPKFSPDGQKIGYLRVNPVSGVYEFWEMSLTGTGQTAKLTSFSVRSWDYALGGDVWLTNGTALFRGNPTAGAYYSLLTAGGTDSFSSICCSPNGALVAYQRTSGAANTIELFDISSLSSTFLRTLPPGAYLNDWAGLPRKRSFIGASGAAMNTTAAGFLYGMSGNRFRSLLAFDSTDPANTSIDGSPAAGISPSNFVATITTAGQLNMLRYVNGYVMPKITVIDTATTATYAKGAVVTYDASDGTVASILPFTTAKTGVKPVQTKAGNLLKLEGDFLGVYDKDGKKTATNVKSVTVDPKDGHVVSAI